MGKNDYVKLSLECISSTPIIFSQPTSIPTPTLHLFSHWWISLCLTEQDLHPH